MVTYQLDDVSPRHVLPRDARRAQRGAHRQGRGADRVRQRLPRGHLRHVRPGDQRQAARPEVHHHLPAAHALVQGRRHDHDRAVARRRLPGDQGPRRRPQRVRPDHPGRRLHLGQHRLGARRPLRAGAEEARPTAPSTRPPASAAAPASRPARTPRRCCSSAPRSPTSASCRRASRSATPAWSHAAASTTTRASAAAPTSVRAPTACPKEIPLDVITQLNKDLRTALRHGR